MKKLLLCASMLGMALPIFAQADIGIEISEVSQDCDTVQCTFAITDSSDSDQGMVLFEVKDLMDSTITGNIMFYYPPLVNYSYTMYAPLISQTFGSHICEITAYNMNGDAGLNNIKDIDLMVCNIGIEGTTNNWCNAVILSKKILVSIGNEAATNVTIFDIHGRIAMETRIFGTTVLPIDVSTGIYSIVVQQGSSIKAFKLAIADWQ